VGAPFFISSKVSLNEDITGAVTSDEPCMEDVGSRHEEVNTEPSFARVSCRSGAIRLRLLTSGAHSRR